MGTTEVGETYTLKLKGLERKILFTDTPGILEAGVAGTQREQMARQLATEADLLLFVVDNDLRRSEYEPLTALVEIGKRSLIITFFFRCQTRLTDRVQPKHRQFLKFFVQLLCN